MSWFGRKQRLSWGRVEGAASGASIGPTAGGRGLGGWIFALPLYKLRQYVTGHWKLDTGNCLFLLFLAILLFITPATWGGILVPDDPFFNYDPPKTVSDGYFFEGQWHLKTMNAPVAWGISTGSAAVIIAILDTAVRSEAVDLAGRVLPAQSVSGRILSPTDSRFEHGTWVASAAAMGVNNGVGGAGVGNFTILPITICDANTFTTAAWLAAGIRLAASSGARVINISYSSSSYGELQVAAAEARALGALTFIAAGNSGTRNTGIADYPDLIFVAGTDQDAAGNEMAWAGSSYGAYVDIAAPANHIVAERNLTPDAYALVSGTSLATPLVSGAAALAWSINPDLTPEQVREIIYSTATDLGAPGWDEHFGWGRLDLGGVAMAALLTTPEPGTLGLLVVGLGVIWRRRGKRRSTDFTECTD